jgi:DNA topoisomerase-2
MGGKDAASARYIFTSLSNITRKLFVEEDDHLLNYLTDDGEVVEPEWYMPILPTVLINGSEGIGTGWSTFIPQFNPKELAENFKRKLRGESFEEMDIDPWYKGFTGKIVWNNKDRDGYYVYGKFERLDHETIRITELPLRKWTRDYKNFLEGLQDKKTGGFIVHDIKENHVQDVVDFELKIVGDFLDKKSDEELMHFFKLQNRISMNNMVLFNS